MIRPAKKLLLILLCTISSGIVNAQFAVDFQLRQRFEWRDGYQKLAAQGQDPAILVSQRTRLGFLYETDILKIRVSPQDVRLWGGDPVMSSSGIVNNTQIGLFEGYAEVRLSQEISVKAGRQQLTYDSHRLLGDRNWNQNGISYDAFVLKASAGRFNIHLGSSWNTLTEALSGNLYPSARIKSLNYLWLNTKINGLKLSLMHIASGVTRSDTTSGLQFRQTSGFFAEYKSARINTWGNVYYQYGRNRNGQPVGALLADADASIQAGKFLPGIGFGYLSGNSQTGAAQSTDHLFDPLYGNRHRYFGFIDYFRSFATDTRQGGLIDLYLYLEYKTGPKTSIRNIAHYFELAQANPLTPPDRSLGFENNLVFKYRFSDWGMFESGYMFFVPTETLKAIQKVADTRFSHFFYIQYTLTPVLFKQQQADKK